MGNKIKGKKGLNVRAVNPDEPIEDDPYWNLSTDSATDHMTFSCFKQFRVFLKTHPAWVQHLLDGVPTYYCVIGVHRGATIDRVNEALTIGIPTQIIPLHVVTEAVKVLTNPYLQKEYDKCLYLFEQSAKMMPADNRAELIRKHSAILAGRKEFDALMRVRNENRDYLNFFANGLPDIYEICGQKKDADIDTLQRECRKDSELFRKIYDILTDPVARQKYDSLMELITRSLTPEGWANREKKMSLWKCLDRAMFDKIVLLTLTESNGCTKYLKRFEEIFNANQDWKDYLPPAKETFLSVLGLDASSVRAMDKKEVEGIIRNKYRDLDRTPKVNLAYSVLKNQGLREDYLWVCDNISFVETLLSLLFVETNSASKSVHRRTTTP